MNDFFFSPFMIPIAGMAMVCVIVAIKSKQRMDERELDARQSLRIKEMEHAVKIKEMELELAKLNAAKPSGTA